MISEILWFVLSNFPFVCLAMGLVASAISFLLRKPISCIEVAERLTAGFIFFAIGVNYTWNFIVHTFFAESTAGFIGWANSPFQYEVGYASLGFAAVGFYAFRREFPVRLAAILGPTFFLWGAAGGHIYWLLATQNHAPGNAGGILYADIILPAIGWAFLFFSRKGHNSVS